MGDLQQGSQPFEWTVRNTLPVWWAFVWRFLIFTTLVSMGIGFCVGLVLAATDHGASARTASRVVSLFVAVPVSVWSFKIALGKAYGLLHVELTHRRLPVDLPD